MSLKFQITSVLPALTLYDNILLALQAQTSLPRSGVFAHPRNPARPRHGHARAVPSGGPRGRSGLRAFPRPAAMARDRDGAGARAEAPAAGRTDRRHEPRGTAGHRRTAAADQEALLPRHRRARSRFHSRHLRPADRARPGKRAGLRLGAAHSVERPRFRRSISAVPDEDHYLDIQNVDAGYGRSQVLFGVTLGVPWRGGVAILGRNGAGKTTLMKAIVGELPLLGGSVSLDAPQTSGSCRPSSAFASASATCRRSTRCSAGFRCATILPSAR